MKYPRNKAERDKEAKKAKAYLDERLGDQWPKMVSDKANAVMRMARKTRRSPEDVINDQLKQDFEKGNLDGAYLGLMVLRDIMGEK